MVVGVNVEVEIIKFCERHGMAVDACEYAIGL